MNKGVFLKGIIIIACVFAMNILSTRCPIPYSAPSLQKPTVVVSDVNENVEGDHLCLVNVDKRLQEAFTWIERAQKATNDGGVSALYNVRTNSHGVSYPEVTGYIIPTILALKDYFNDDFAEEMAVNMANWLLSIQLSSGAFPARDLKTPYTFDTGQAILGLLAAYEAVGNPLYYEAAMKAGEYLVSVQLDGGGFPTSSSNQSPRTFHSRVSWALLKLWKNSGDKIFKESAVKNLDWVLRQQGGNGYFRDADTRGTLTHYLAYTGRGLLESGLILKKEKYINGTKYLCDKLRSLQLNGGSLYGEYSDSWKPTVQWSCLTGNLQIALLWLRIYQITGEERYLKAAKDIIIYTSVTQNLDTNNLGIRGGIPGSAPNTGYFRDHILSWATKFFIDALLEVQSVNNGGMKTDVSNMLRGTGLSSIITGFSPLSRWIWH